MLNSKISKAVRLAIAFGAVSATAIATNANAADGEEIEKIEITGSSIKGSDLAGALPINVITAEDIKATGVTSVPDLVAQIPSMQGFTTPVSSVGGGGGGTSTASLRGIGEQYTLVLLNGRRLAPSGSGNSIDLNTIPLAAIERVDVLTDGASALYGSDAIAGVINFITKKEVDGTTIAARTDRPKDGAESVNLSVVTGFGDLDSDGFTIVASLSHDTRESLRSKDRDFAKTGLLEFTHNGNQYYDVQGSSNAIPGNAFVGLNDGSNVAFTPYALSNGNKCAPDNAFAPGSNFCSFDYTSTLEIVPEDERTSLMLQGDFILTDDMNLFSTVAFTNYLMTPRIAPNPTGNINIGTESVLYDKYVVPNLTAEQLASGVDTFRGRWRALPGGNRTTEWETDSLNTIVGLEGTIADTIDFNTAVVYSRSERTQTLTNGYYNAEKFVENIRSGLIDIFLTPEDFAQNEAAVAALEDSQYRALEDTTTTESLSFDFKASQAIFELPAGEAYIGYGADYRTNSYKVVRSEANISNARFGDGGGDFDYELERSTYGVFAELQIPVLDELSANVAVRYDNIGAVEDTMNGGKVNDSENDTTYKISLRYSPTDSLVFRASYGTGFKAASLLQIAEPETSFGVTTAPYSCPLPASDSRAQFCPPGALQYQRFNLGSSTLSPETSKQSSIGFVYSPTTDFTFELDYWQVNIEDMVQRPDQNYMFANPQLFDERFVLRTDRSDPTNTLLSVITAPINIGESKSAGFDWKVMLTNDLSFGELKTMVQGTYMDKSEYTLAGVFPYEWASSLGRYGVDQDVVFRNIINIQNVLTHGDFAHTLRMKYRSGWHDQASTVGVGTIANAETEVVYNDQGVGSTQFVTADVQFKVPSHMTVDYKIDYRGFENMNITVGVNNLFDKEPPMSLGDAEGHLVGYEGRYYDQYLRTYYLSLDYTF
ncbi:MULTISPECIES: TonB-dependent receptor domain-containing protein [Pseudoalteromonas]|uniref:TonB-dependent receptor n=1 Tax=Pseudoalteromonas obscura TaxID=3048491 RepID=A0ABT7EHS1_9GAMM|nr:MULTISPECIES: TonB-dependent receptor [Pseudoalteromonas]MBQ4836214.1 TonB-dependent receptor [Pseudoalteromonas luteoviolacea]MDK2594564.1 TonB-dependent receptor [Pseudoalteromonas sp. P94(2023)]